jgi:hypothetical protein
MHACHHYRMRRQISIGKPQKNELIEDCISIADGCRYRLKIDV